MEKEKSQYLKDKEAGKLENSRFFNKDNKVFTEDNKTNATEAKLFYEQDNFKLYQGSNLDVLPTLPDNSVDSIVTDPPYELGFMGKSWDSSGIAYNVELWKQCLRVLKPGGHLIAFSGSRTYHRMAVAIEDAGFEIRDQIMWIYGSGFPKASDVAKQIDKQNGYQGKVVGKAKGVGNTNTLSMRSGGGNENEKLATEYDVKELSPEAKKWDGWKSALKPAHEPMVLARKPLEKGLTIAQNILKWGVGALNIDESRIESDEKPFVRNGNKNIKKYESKIDQQWGMKEIDRVGSEKGRYPANVIHDGSSEVISHFPDTKKGGAIHKDYQINNNIYGDMSMMTSNHTDGYGDSGSAARFFYGAKAQTDDRDQGLDNQPLQRTAFSEGARASLQGYKLNDNVPPEVIKEIKLWLEMNTIQEER